MNEVKVVYRGKSFSSPSEALDAYLDDFDTSLPDQIFDMEIRKLSRMAMPVHHHQIQAKLDAYSLPSWIRKDDRSFLKEQLIKRSSSKTSPTMSSPKPNSNTFVSGHSGGTYHHQIMASLSKLRGGGKPLGQSTPVASGHLGVQPTTDTDSRQCVVRTPSWVEELGSEFWPKAPSWIEQLELQDGPYRGSVDQFPPSDRLLPDRHTRQSPPPPPSRTQATSGQRRRTRRHTDPKHDAVTHAARDGAGAGGGSSAALSTDTEQLLREAQRSIGRVNALGYFDDESTGEISDTLSDSSLPTLSGDRPWERHRFLTKPLKAVEPTPSEAALLIDRYLSSNFPQERCISGGGQPGTMEILKKMFYSLQTIADPAPELPNGAGDGDGSVRTSPDTRQARQPDRSDDRENCPALESAMHHLEHLKRIIATSSTSTGAASPSVSSAETKKSQLSPQLNEQEQT